MVTVTGRGVVPNYNQLLQGGPHHQPVINESGIRAPISRVITNPSYQFTRLFMSPRVSGT